ncbi:glutamic acid-rich protein-like [Penaeus monodon]|uniref:glutamic acid-rich protein-like n=1 Tax=Penaeus monodon TaxID=6687 RepID=UPI0018A6DB24|nr:glutamic acid-rich protein-like [Penaeus monodon]
MEIETQTQEGNESNIDFNNCGKTNPNLKTNEKADRKKKLDALYDKHSEERYWIHLRMFLLQSGVTKTDKLEKFFNRSASLKYSDTENYNNANKDALEEESCYNTSENGSVLLKSDNNPKTADTFSMCSSEECFSSNKNTSKTSIKSDDDSCEYEEHIGKKFKSAGEEQDNTNKEESENEYSLQTKMLKQEGTDAVDMDEVMQGKEMKFKRRKRKKPNTTEFSNTSGLAWAVQILQKHSDGTRNTVENEKHIESLRDSETQVYIPLDSSIASLSDELNKNTCPDISSSLDGIHSKAVSLANEGITNTKPNNCKGSLGIVENNSDIQTLRDSEQMVTSSEGDKNEMKKQKSRLLKRIIHYFSMHVIRICIQSF